MGLLATAFMKAADYAFGSGQTANIFPQVEPEPVTLQRAVEIFDAIAAMPTIGWRYPEEGCYARAHMAVREMFDMALTPKKAWAFERDRGELLVKLSNGMEISWWSHVAPALPVIMPDGKVQDLVLDPALFKGPVTLKEWGAVMDAPDYNLMIAEAGRAPRGHNGDYTPWNRTGRKTDARAEKDMLEYLPLQHDALPLFPSPLRELVEKNDEYLRGEAKYAAPPEAGADAPQPQTKELG